MNAARNHIKLSRRRLIGLLGISYIGTNDRILAMQNLVDQTGSKLFPSLYFDGHYAHASAYHPLYVHHIVYHANVLTQYPYKRGGGHRQLFDGGYDCSGSISYILFRSGLLDKPLTSAQFAQYGKAGPGNYVTLYINPGKHVFMTVCGLRYDTSGPIRLEGPRWRTMPRNYAGFQQRSIPGL